MKYLLFCYFLLHDTPWNLSSSEHSGYPRQTEYNIYTLSKPSCGSSSRPEECRRWLSARFNAVNAGSNRCLPDGIYSSNGIYVPQIHPIVETEFNNHCRVTL